MKIQDRNRPKTIRHLVSLGVESLEHHRYNEAVACFSRALAIEPENTDSMHLYGLSCERALDLLAAVKFLRRATLLAPSFATAFCNFGVAQSKLGNTLSALEAYEKAVVHDPALSAAYIHIAGIRACKNEHELASRFFELCVRFAPADDQCRHNLAVAMNRLGRLDKADVQYQKCLVLAPSRPDSMLAFYKAHDDKPTKNSRSTWLKSAAVIEPSSAVFQSELGLYLADREQNDEAIAHFQRALTVDPAEQEHYNNLGLSLGNTYHDIQALHYFSRAVLLEHDNAPAHYNAGISLGHIGLLDKSIKSYERACVIDPSNIDALWNRSHSLLLSGDFEAGWKEFECRWLIKKFRNLRRSKLRKTDRRKNDSYRGKTVLLIAEQGLGDTIQFVRYARLLSMQGAKVIVSAQRPLTRLLSHQPGIDAVTAWEDPLPQHDRQYFMMSLPLLFGTTLESVPCGDSPYLHPIPREAAQWLVSLDDHLPAVAGELRRLRVGVVWNGGFRPDQPDVWSLNEKRNVPLRIFADALDSKDIDFVSLQKGNPAESEIRGSEHKFWRLARFFNPSEHLKDFADTAALVSNLDLVIGVDTSTTHLSAALGVPTWLINRYDTCWRWLQDRDDSPWYRCLRVYRQGPDRDWRPVLSRVAENLRQRVAGHGVDYR